MGWGVPGVCLRVFLGTRTASFYYYLHIKEMNRLWGGGGRRWGGGRHTHTHIVFRGSSEISGQESAAWEVGEGEITSGLNIIVYLFVA